MSPITLRHVACARCPFKRLDPHPATCDKDGKTLDAHYDSGECPEGRYPAATAGADEKPPAGVAVATTGERKPCCGQKLLNGAVGLAKVGAQMVGIPIDQAPRKLEASRLRICTACAPGAILCPDCDCIIKAKVRIKSEKCPRGKWPDVT